MNERIGAVAGRVWKHLGEHGRASVTELSQSIQVPPGLVTLALGWLAREDKVALAESIGPRSPACIAALTPGEQRIFDDLKPRELALT